MTVLPTAEIDEPKVVAGWHLIEEGMRDVGSHWLVRDTVEAGVDDEDHTAL